MQDKEKFWIILDEYWNLILHSSEHVPYDDVDWEKFDPIGINENQMTPIKINGVKLHLALKRKKEKIWVLF